MLYNDERLSIPLAQLADRVSPDLVVRSVPSSNITYEHTGRVLIPCIAASRVGSDLKAAVQKANISK